MKFDAARVADDITTFSHPRFAGSSGEARAREELARRIDSANWREFSITTVSSRTFHTWKGYLLWTGMLSVLILTALTIPIWVKVGAIGMVVLTLIVSRSKIDTRPAPPNFKAISAGATGVRPSLIVLTRLDTTRRDWSRGRIGLVSASAIALFLLSVGFNSTSKVVAIVLCAVISLPLMVPHLRPFRNQGGVSRSDNRTGLALLCELSRTLPKTVLERMDVGLIAIGGEVFDDPETWAELAGIPHSGQPRLLILLQNPAVGPVIRIASDIEGVVARSAANDLRIPCKIDTPSHRDRSVDLPVVRIAGNSRDSADIEPRLFQPTLHLIGEVALRWAKTKASA